MQDTQLAFTLFLEEGYRQRGQSNPSARVLALIAAAIFEVRFKALVAVRALPATVQPLAVYVALAPFLGWTRPASSCSPPCTPSAAGPRRSPEDEHVSPAMPGPLAELDGEQALPRLLAGAQATRVRSVFRAGGLTAKAPGRDPSATDHRSIDVLRHFLAQVGRCGAVFGSP